MNKLILASKSPRRIELIKLLDPYTVSIPSDADETFDPNRSPEQNVISTAYKKAKQVFDSNPVSGEQVVIGVDTIVVCGGIVLTKPADRADAYRMLSMYSGGTHSVLSGVALLSNEKTLTFCERTDVTFLDLSPEEINTYLNTDEPYDKAGAYGIQGMAGLFVRSIQGCYYNVMGLPISALYHVLRSEFSFSLNQ